MTHALLIDTTLRGVSCGLLQRKSVSDSGDWELIATTHHFENFGSAASLPRLVDGLLAACGQDLTAVKTIAVANGPGTFTGIKVGLAYASGLTTGASERNLAALSALEWLAKTWSEADALLCLPATKSHGYVTILADDGSVNLYVAEIDGDRLILTHETSKEELASFDLKVRQPVMLLRWPELATWFAKQGVHAKTLDYPLVAAKVLEAMRQGFIRLNLWQAFNREMPTARYARASTPEERLQAKR